MPSHLVEVHLTPVRSAQWHVLVADDDLASCRFLCDGLRSLGAQSTACSNGSDAIALARGQRFDLLLLDCRMPGGGALEILTSLRVDLQAGSAGCEAIATTAELSPEDKARLLQAGFSDILLKPCSIANLRAALARVGVPTPGLLDDTAAMHSTGDSHTMRALRVLLQDELRHLQVDLESLRLDPVKFSERLHRLRSSCGFCGARALAVQTASLQQQLHQAAGISASLASFRRTLNATLQALED